MLTMPIPLSATVVYVYTNIQQQPIDSSQVTHHIPYIVPKYMSPLPIVCDASNAAINAQ